MNIVTKLYMKLKIVASWQCEDNHSNWGDNQLRKANGGKALRLRVDMSPIPVVSSFGLREMKRKITQQGY